jgi:geranylgeranyl transferase type-2 subunit alpha
MSLELALIGNALNVGPEDQSLWYYHQFLVCNLLERDPERSIVPYFSTEERLRYLEKEIVDIKDFLEDYKNIKWIYEALLEYTLSTAKIEQREVNIEENKEVGEWLEKLRTLDPMRNGRWEDISRSLGLE